MTHHGEPVLESKDIKLCTDMALWIKTAREAGYDKDWLPSEVDIIKSRLFWRIRSGKQPLLEAPPRCYSCPWYEVVEEDRPHWVGECFVHEKDVIIGQCQYKIIEWESINERGKVQFLNYKFNVWKGSNEITYWNYGKQLTKSFSGWWIQIDNTVKGIEYNYER